MGSFGHWLSKKKSRLFLNGDWLYVTETPTDSKQLQQDDLAAKFDTPEEVLTHLTSSEPDIVKLIYERAKDRESRIENIGNLTRDKAKILLGTTSFASTVFFGVASFFSSSSVNPPWWAVAAELIVFILLACHLIRSLVIGMEVMTREQSISASPDEFLDSYGDSSVDAYKNAIAQTVAYANRTHEYIRERSNKLILGQHAFRYGLMYFVLLVVLHIFSNYGHVGPGGYSAVAAEQQTKLLQSLLSNQNSFLKGLDGATKEMALLHQTDGEIIKKQRELETKVEDIRKVVTVLQQEMMSITQRSGPRGKNP